MLQQRGWGALPLETMIMDALRGVRSEGAVHRISATPASSDVSVRQMARLGEIAGQRKAVLALALKQENPSSGGAAPFVGEGFPRP